MSDTLAKWSRFLIEVTQGDRVHGLLVDAQDVDMARQFASEAVEAGRLVAVGIHGDQPFELEDRSRLMAAVSEVPGHKESN